MLSGAVLDPSALKDLVPDFEQRGAPLGTEVHHDHVYFLTRGSKATLPITPPPLKNHGNYIISLNRFVKWLGGLVEAEGIDVFTGFSAAEVLYDGNRVVGVRTGDRGIGQHGEVKSTFEPGVDIRAKVTILTDGVRGNPDQGARPPAGARRGEAAAALRARDQGTVGSAEGPPRAGTVIHTMGYPLRMEEFGGGFIYAMPDGLLSGRVRERPRLSRSDVRSARHVPALQAHPLVASLLAAGRWSATAPRRCPKAAGTRCRGSTPTAC